MISLMIILIKKVQGNWEHGVGRGAAIPGKDIWSLKASHRRPMHGNPKG
jgi:hypothetical protein